MADSGAGTSVTLVVPATSVPPAPAPPPGTLPLTGLDLLASLALGALMLTLGLTAARAGRSHPSRSRP